MTKYAPADPGTPVYLTSFIGREAEVEAICRLRSEARVVTLVGPGGSGKTRLACEVVAAADEADRFIWVDLTRVSDPEPLVSEVAHTVGVPELGPAMLWSSLVEALGQTPSTLVLDNCEHVIAAAAAFVEQSVQRCPRLSVLATSREPLDIAGERSFRVAPLSLPPADVVSAESAMAALSVRLFVERAQQASPAFVLTDDNAPAVVAICRRLDGIPLAIELAAARARALSPSDIESRLDDVFALLTGGRTTALPRHRTLRATLDWSYQLLSAQERTLLHRLCVFEGGATLPAIEAVCAGDAIEGAEILDLLDRLVAKSMLVAEDVGGATRFSFLQTVLQYGTERLAEQGEVATHRLRDAHARHFSQLADQHQVRLYHRGWDRAWVDNLDRDMPNLRAATTWLSSRGRHEEAMRVLSAMDWCWFILGRYAEGRARLERVLAAVPSAPTLTRCHALSVSSHMAFLLGDHEGVIPPAMQAAEGLAGLGPPADDHEALVHGAIITNNGMALSVAGDFTAAGATLDRALALYRARRVDAARIYVLYWRGKTAEGTGDPTTAETCYEQAVDLAGRLRFDGGVLHLLIAHGWLLHVTGRNDEALRAYGRVLQHLQRAPDMSATVFTIVGLAGVALDRQPDEVTALFACAADELAARLGMVHHPAEGERNRHVVQTVRERLGVSRFETIRARAARLGFDEAVALATQTFASGERPAAGSAALPPAAALTVRALGPMQVLVGDAPLPARVWNHAKPRELLIYLLLHPKGRTRQQIGLALWPEASEAKVKNNVNVALHRLRKVLGDGDWIGIEQGRYRVDAQRSVDFDVHRFESLITRGLAAHGSSDREALLRDAVQLCRGDFLDGETAGDWHLDHRERLTALATRAHSALGALLEARSAWSEAAACYEAVVARDAFDETATRALMRCHVQAGDRPRALRAYRRLRVLLENELDAEPERDTTALFEAIAKRDSRQAPAHVQPRRSVAPN